MERLKPELLNEFEKRLQDADMPRCPFCHGLIMANGERAPMVFFAHGMMGLAHEACCKEIVFSKVAP